VRQQAARTRDDLPWSHNLSGCDGRDYDTSSDVDD